VGRNITSLREITCSDGCPELDLAYLGVMHHESIATQADHDAIIAGLPDLQFLINSRHVVLAGTPAFCADLLPLCSAVSSLELRLLQKSDGHQWTLPGIPELIIGLSKMTQVRYLRIASTGDFTLGQLLALANAIPSLVRVTFYVTSCGPDMRSHEPNLAAHRTLADAWQKDARAFKPQICFVSCLSWNTLCDCAASSSFKVDTTGVVPVHNVSAWIGSCAGKA